MNNQNIMPEYSLSMPKLKEILKTVLGKGLALRLKVTGFSMFPFIRNEDIVTIFPLKKACGVGDVVVFIHPLDNNVVIHRIIAQRNNAFVIVGDNSFETKNDLIPKEAIQGIVIKIERNNRIVRFGLGKEKFLIVVLARLKIIALLNKLGRNIPSPLKKFIFGKIL